MSLGRFHTVGGKHSNPMAQINTKISVSPNICWRLRKPRVMAGNPGPDVRRIA